MGAWMVTFSFTRLELCSFNASAYNGNVKEKYTKTNELPKKMIKGMDGGSSWVNIVVTLGFSHATVKPVFKTDT